MRRQALALACLILPLALGACVQEPYDSWGEDARWQQEEQARRAEMWERRRAAEERRRAWEAERAERWRQEYERRRAWEAEQRAWGPAQREPYGYDRPWGQPPYGYAPAPRYPGETPYLDGGGYAPPAPGWTYR